MSDYDVLLSKIMDANNVHALGGNRSRWREEEDEVLRQYYGKVGRKELLSKINAVNKDKNENRTFNSIVNRVAHLGLTADDWRDGTLLTLREACDEWGFTDNQYYAAHKAANSGCFPSERKGKCRYVRREDWSIWADRFAAQIKYEEEIKQWLAEEGIETVSKNAARKLAGVGETQIHRLLRSEVIRAWFVTQGVVEGQGYWLVDKKQAEQYRQIRASGKLKQHLRQFPKYHRITRVEAKEINRLRRQDRVGKRDPLTKPASKMFPGNFTIRQVASHTRQSAEAVYNDIREGKIEAVQEMRGGRIRYALPPAVAKDYAALVLANRKNELGTSRQKRIAHEAGFLVVDDLIKRWGMSRDEVHRLHLEGVETDQGVAKLKAIMFGRLRAFKPTDVKAFAQALGWQTE